jgi:hypothetical protein
MKRLIPFALLLVVFCSCNNAKEDKKEIPASTVDTSSKIEVPKDEDGLNQQDSIKATGRQILILLKESNYSELVKYFSSEGVVFSPYGFVDTAKSKKLTPDDFLESISKKWILTWGSYDGTGDPIKHSVPNYLKKFVYNADYLNAEAVGFDQIIILLIITLVVLTKKATGWIGQASEWYSKKLMDNIFW